MWNQKGSWLFRLHPCKLIWQWKTSHLKMYVLLKNDFPIVMLVFAGAYILGPYMLYPILYIYMGHIVSHFRISSWTRISCKNLTFASLFKKKTPTMQRSPNHLELLKKPLGILDFCFRNPGTNSRGWELIPRQKLRSPAKGLSIYDIYVSCPGMKWNCHFSICILVASYIHHISYSSNDALFFQIV